MSDSKQMRLTRRSFLRRAAVITGSLTVGVGLLEACTQPATPAATQAPKPAATTAPAPAATAAPAATQAPAAATTPFKGKVVIAVPEEQRTLSSWEAYATTGYPVLRNVEEALLNRDPKTNAFVGELATAWKVKDPSTWTFTLRKGVKFHDGSPFNAESAAFGLNWNWSKQNNFQIRSYLGPELNATVVDDYTIDVKTEKPDPILPNRLYFSPIPSMKQIKEKPADYVSVPIGTGPYKFVSWTKGQSTKLEANPEWWGLTASDAYGKLTIKDVEFVPRSEREVRVAMVKTGEADVARWITVEQTKQVPASSGGPTVETGLLRLDNSHAAMKDMRVRQAIAFAIDKKSITDDILGGGQLAAMIAGPLSVGYNPDLKPYAYDLDQAKKLLAEAKAAGVQVDAPITVMCRKGAYIRVEEATEAMSNMLNKAGLKTTAKVLETAPYEELWGARARGPIPADRGMAGFHFHGNEIGDFAISVDSYYKSTGVTSTIEDLELDKKHEAASQLTGDERNKAYQAIAKYIYDKYFYVPVCYPNFYFGISSKVDWKSRTDGFILVKEMALRA
ncbi:MAG: ABC transporter substrate-binding protein [Chloroflexota bacterium]